MRLREYELKCLNVRNFFFSFPSFMMVRTYIDDISEKGKGRMGATCI